MMVEVPWVALAALAVAEVAMVAPVAMAALVEAAAVQPLQRPSQLDACRR